MLCVLIEFLRGHSSLVLCRTVPCGVTDVALYPLGPGAPVSESAGNQSMSNFEQEKNSPRRMEMSPGGGESWTETEAERRRGGGLWRSNPPFPNAGL